MKKIFLMILVISIMGNFAFAQCTCAAGCSSITTVTLPFTKDGVADACYQTPCLGSSINSWNLATLNINGIDFTNKWADPATYPAAISGQFYIYYKSAVSWGHFEALGACSGSTSAPSDTITPTTAPNDTLAPTTPPGVTAAPTETPAPTAIPTATPVGITAEPTAVSGTIAPTGEPGINMTAVQLASQLKVGWNLGNTLEAICGETAWGNPTATQTLINAVKNTGFNAIRLPVAWDCHSSNSVIDAAWLARVKTVVDYCITANVYVIINIHWDNGWLENNVTTSAQAAVNAKQQAYWTQIANTFKTYDQRVLFASANEPNVSDATGMSVLLTYHQTFINAVRATGGNNSSRILVIQGPSTDIDQTNNLMNTLPTDTIANRLIVEVHYYTPWNFCGLTTDESWGSMFYYWGSGYHSTIEPSRNATWGEESDVEKYLGYMKTKFVDKGIPVIIGEFGAMQRSNPADLAMHLNSRDYYHNYVVKSAKSKGITIFFWDTGSLFDRNSGAIKDQRTVNALITGANN